MKLRHVGYACINRTLDLTTGHTLRLANLERERIAEVIATNLDNLERILEWNVEHGICFFRISSSVIPFASHAEFTWPWRRRFSSRLDDIRKMADRHQLRLSMHPGQYTVLNSTKPEVVDRAVAELDYHASFLEAVTPDGGDIVVHVGGAYGDKETSIARFAEHFDRLSASARRQLVVENDDTIYTVDDVLDLSRRIECPVVFDIFHHRCNPPADHWRDGLEARLEEVVRSWGGRVPKCHISTRREGTRTSHADFIARSDFDDFGAVMAEAAAQRVLEWR